MAFIEMLRWGIVPGTKNLAWRPGPGALQECGESVDGRQGPGGGPARVRWEVAAAADWGSSDAACALSPCLL